ncbi:unnamed protein product [Pleuronectes platessa]|uniref:Uncharacterized protein n=1 Tax=Pleuronectes platessa TaxID=8262 RepID=A0A9N7U4W7_PLEPL|nr:unnamed protein product [Pleuronectes platessa]
MGWGLENGEWKRGIGVDVSSHSPTRQLARLFTGLSGRREAVVCHLVAGGEKLAHHWLSPGQEAERELHINRAPLSSAPHRKPSDHQRCVEDPDTPSLWFSA